jgi:hypothetical protein
MSWRTERRRDSARLCSAIKDIKPAAQIIEDLVRDAEASLSTGSGDDEV